MNRAGAVLIAAGDLLTYMTNPQTLNESYHECAVALGSFTIDSTRSTSGIQFSYPYLNSGLGILVATAVGVGDGGPACLSTLNAHMWT